MDHNSQTCTRGFIERVRYELAREADPAKSGPMQAYMKSAMPFYGVKAPEVRRVCRRVFAEFPMPTRDAWLDAVLTLWREATHREERYVALSLAADKRYKAFLDLDVLPAVREMIVTGAWWDYVDDISGSLVAPLLRRHPAEMAAVLRGWASGDDLWLRRAGIVCQRGFKGDTDFGLLRDCILPSNPRREFFLAKGIGWALREYAKTCPEAVVAFVREHEAEMAPLAKREALRIVKKQGFPRV